MSNANCELETLRSSLYGESLFITLLVTPLKQLIFFDAQWNKLSRVMQQIVDNWDDQYQKNKVLLELLTQLPPEQYARVRIQVHFQAQAWPLLLSSPKERASLSWEVVVRITPIVFALEQVPMKRVAPYIRVLDSRLMLDCKVGSYGFESLNFLTKNFPKNIDDYLWINPDQSFRECSTSNIFVRLKTGEWITPPAKECYQGVTRQHLLCWLVNRGYQVSEDKISLQDLGQIAYVLFTNAIQIMGLMYLESMVEVTQQEKENIRQLRSDFYLEMLATTSRRL